MNLLIKDMEMPKHCWQCRLKDEDDNCTAADATQLYSVMGVYGEERRPDWCPLVELPDHGELIDRDELMKHGVYMPMPGGNLPLVYMSYVKGAKAVIPAEGSEE